MQKVIPPKRTTLPIVDWLETVCDLAVILADDYGEGLESTTDENGDEYYTFDSQEKFNLLTVEAESILLRLGFECEGRK